MTRNAPSSPRVLLAIGIGIADVPAPDWLPDSIMQGSASDCRHDATHEHPMVQHWLARLTRIHMHPPCSFWRNLVEWPFDELTAKQLRRGVFRSVLDLIAVYMA
jgi:hypothetical protein